MWSGGSWKGRSVLCPCPPDLLCLGRLDQGYKQFLSLFPQLFRMCFPQKGIKVLFLRLCAPGIALQSPRGLQAQASPSTHCGCGSLQSRGQDGGG